MTEAERIADQLRRAVDGKAWSGPSLGEVLAGVTARQAAAKPIAGAHSIWEIALHIAVWSHVPRRRLAGEPLLEIPPAEDWPAFADTSDAAWRRDSERVLGDLRAFASQIAELDDVALARKLPQDGGQMAPVWFMLHGVVQHVLYHAGQVALLKKAAASGQ